jgi:citronellol/citronellal dehydrogenase
VKVLRDDALAGRRALVTGAGTGIGRAVALRLAELGADVVGVGRRPEPLAETASLGEVEARQLDVRDGDAVRAFDFGAVDVLVNNAGGQFVAAADAISERGFAAVLDLNLTAVARLVDVVQPRETVVTISLSSPERGIPGMAHSATARAAIAGLTARLAIERPEVAFYCLAPGTVLTDGVREELDEAALLRVLERTPLGSDTPVEAVAEWVAALAAGIAPAASGSLLELDGGAGLRGAVGALL